MDIRAGHAAVQDVAENSHVQIFDGALAIANRQGVEQALRGVLVRAVACVDDGNVQMAGNEFRRARGFVPHHERVGLHRVQRLDRVQERLALFQARGFGLQIHGVRAEARSRRAEADPRAGRVLEKGQRNSLAAQRGQLLQGMFLNFLEGLALIQQKAQFFRAERFECQQVAEAVGHVLLAIYFPATRSTSITRSSLSTSRNRTSIISVSEVWTARPIN